MKIQADAIPIRADISEDSLVGILLESRDDPQKIKDEINAALQASGVTRWDVDSILEWCREKIQEEAEQSDASSWDDDYSDFSVKADTEDDELFIDLEGSGYAYCSPGMKGDYYTPDDPDEYTWKMNRVTICLWPHDEDGDEIGEWDITNLLN